MDSPVARRRLKPRRVTRWIFAAVTVYLVWLAVQAFGMAGGDRIAALIGGGR